MLTAKVMVRATTLACLLATAACLAPEKGDVEISIDKTGGYVFTYRGSMAYLLGLAAGLRASRSNPETFRE